MQKAGPPDPTAFQKHLSIIPCHALNEITFSLDQMSLNDLGLWCLKGHRMFLPPDLEPFQIPGPSEKGKRLIKVGSIGEGLFKYLEKNQAVEGHLLNIFSLIYS